MADTNPANLANLPKEKVQEIASMGGKASHSPSSNDESKDINGSTTEGRNPDGTFTKDSKAAKEAGHVGGLHAAGKEAEADKENQGNGRRDDGTFKPGSEAAKDAGHKGGLAAAASNN